MEVGGYCFAVVQFQLPKKHSLGTRASSQGEGSFVLSEHSPAARAGVLEHLELGDAPGQEAQAPRDEEEQGAGKTVKSESRT